MGKAEEARIWWWTGGQVLLSHSKRVIHKVACAGVSEFVAAAWMLMNMQLCRGSSLHRGLQPDRAVPVHVGGVYIAAAFRS